MELSKDMACLWSEVISESFLNHVMLITGVPCTLQDNSRGSPVFTRCKDSSLVVNVGTSVN